MTREQQAEEFKRVSGKVYHTSDCATSIAPAEESGPCDCDAPTELDEEFSRLVSPLRESYLHEGWDGLAFERLRADCREIENQLNEKFITADERVEVVVGLNEQALALQIGYRVVPRKSPFDLPELTENKLVGFKRLLPCY